MKKKPLSVEEQLWRKGINATPAAVLIDELTRPTTISIAPIFNDLEQRHGMNIRACWKGIVVERDGEIIYEDGKYERVGARTEDEKVAYRRRMYAFLRWCCTHYPTDLLKMHKGWIYGR